VFVGLDQVRVESWDEPHSASEVRLSADVQMTQLDQLDQQQCQVRREILKQVSLWSKSTLNIPRYGLWIDNGSDDDKTMAGEPGG
jgi:hypothetical protein